MPRVTRKGEVSIPKKIREVMSINPDSEVNFQICKGECVLKKVVRDDVFGKWAGYLKIKKTTNKIIQELRGE